MSTYEFDHLKQPKNVASGIAEFAFIAPADWFDVLQVPTAPFAVAGDKITITATHTFTAGKGFLKHQLAPQKNSLEYKTRGDMGLNGQDAELKVFIPGSYEQAHEQVGELLNTPLVVLVKDSTCGVDWHYQLGCDCLKAYLKADFTSGTTKDGVKGYMATISYDDGPLIYKGDVTEKA